MHNVKQNKKKQLQSIVGEAIADIRKSLNWTQEKLALEADIAQAVLGRIERGIRTPRLDTFIKIALALDMEPSDLFDSMDLSEYEL